MKYKFELFERHDSGWNGKMVPTLVIGEHPAYGEFFSAEINNLRLSYLRDQIIPSLEKVMDGRLERYNFGFEIYDFVCDRQTCKVIDLSEDDHLEAEIPVQEIYAMLRDWMEHMSKWRAQEGLAAD